MEQYKIRENVIDDTDGKYGKTIIYYISDKDLSIDDITNHTYPVLATAHVGWYYKDYKKLRRGRKCIYEGIATIVGITVSPEYRNIGIGYKLLETIVSDARSNSMTVVKVDDMSDRHRQDHNLYVKLGFEYVSDWGPEMIFKL